jgi:hypothetical protein
VTIGRGFGLLRDLHRLGVGSGDGDSTSSDSHRTVSM